MVYPDWVIRQTSSIPIITLTSSIPMITLTSSIPVITLPSSIPMITLCRRVLVRRWPHWTHFCLRVYHRGWVSVGVLPGHPLRPPNWTPTRAPTPPKTTEAPLQFVPFVRQKPHFQVLFPHFDLWFFGIFEFFPDFWWIHLICTLYCTVYSVQ